MSHFRGPHRLAQADLAGPLGHRDQHDVHDADSADQERDGGDSGEQGGEGARHAGGRLLNRRLVQKEKSSAWLEVSLCRPRRHGFDSRLGGFGGDCPLRPPRMISDTAAGARLMGKHVLHGGQGK